MIFYKPFLVAVFLLLLTSAPFLVTVIHKQMNHCQTVPASKNSQHQLISTVEEIAETLNRTEQEDNISKNTEKYNQSGVNETGKKPSSK